MKTIPAAPVVLFINEALAITVFMLSLTSPPAMGISFAAPYFIPFMARLSALAWRVVLRDIMPVKSVKYKPVIHSDTDFKRVEMPDRFTFLHKMFAAINEQFAFISGRIRFAHIICKTDTVPVPMAESKDEESVFPDAA